MPKVAFDLIVNASSRAATGISNLRPHQRARSLYCHSRRYHEVQGNAYHSITKRDCCTTLVVVRALLAVTCN